MDGDHDREKALTAEMMKLIGNSSYSRITTNNENMMTLFTLKKQKLLKKLWIPEIAQEIMDPKFFDSIELLDGFYEVEKTKKKTTLDFSVHIGVFILNYTKV